MKRVLVIFNKNSGRAKLRCRKKMIAKQLELLGLQYECIPLPPKGEEIDFEEIEKKYHFDVILIAGGDGTIRTVLQQMYMKGIEKEISVFPTGSANVFCKMHDIPKSLEYLKNPKRKKIGLSLLNEKEVFCIAAVFGKAAQMTIDAHGMGKHIFGFLSYGIAAISSVFRFARKDVVFRGRKMLCHSVLILSSEFSEKVLPKELSRKDHLSGIFMEEKKIFQLLRTFKETFSQKIMPQNTLIDQQTKIDFTADFEKLIHIDGDPIISTEKRFSGEYKKNIFTLLVPQKTHPL
jgi:diacylglycerol kinase family enzyme